MTTGDGSADSARAAAPPSLSALSNSVQKARAVVRRRRHPPVVPAELAAARRALVAALADYAAGLEQRHLPVPPALRSELEMHRQLFGR